MKQITQGYEVLPDLMDFSNEEIKKRIELFGRVCYKSEESIKEDSYDRFYTMLTKRKHFSVLEHANLVIGVEIAVYNALITNIEVAESKILKHMEFSKDDKRAYISANLRTWLDFYEYRNDATVVLIMQKFLSESYPEIFPKNDTYQYANTPYLFEIIKDVKSLPGWKKHLRRSVRFVCDRGVSHEVVRHRIMAFSQESTRYCNYSELKGVEDIIFIDPRISFEFDKTVSALSEKEKNDLYKVICEANENSEKAYNKIIKIANSPQIARDVLSHNLKTEIIISGTIEFWEAFMALRVPETAHPRMREITVFNKLGEDLFAF